MEEIKRGDKKEQMHTKILNYFRKNKGLNLKLLEDGLVLFYHSDSNFNIQKEDYNSIEEYFDELLKHDDKPYLTFRDLTCFNENDNALVILELKTEKANFETFGQILFYLINAEVIENANEKNVKKLRGIILASEIDKSLKELIKKYKNMIPEISLKEYKWTFEGELIIEDIDYSQIE